MKLSEIITNRIVYDIAMRCGVSVEIVKPVAENGALVAAAALGVTLDEETRPMPDDKGIFGNDVESLATVDAAIDHLIAKLNGTVLEGDFTIPTIQGPIHYKVTITTPQGTK
jgi:hypothetical protein